MFEKLRSNSGSHKESDIYRKKKILGFVVDFSISVWKKKNRIKTK